MQLIELIEPSEIDIKNDMSTLEDTIENNQINGAVDKENDIIVKITTCKNDTTIIENTNGDSPIKEQLENKLKDLNGISKSNGNAPTLLIDNCKYETEMYLIGNEIAVNDQSNGSSLLSESCENTNSNVTHIETVVENTHLEKSSSDLNKNVDSSQENKVTKPDNLLNKEEIRNVPVEDIPVNLNAQNIMNSEEASASVELKNIKIDIEIESKPPNVSDFSPNSDTNEAVNISAQLQQLENDASIEVDDVNDNQLKLEVSTTLNNDQLATPIHNEENENLRMPSEENDNIADSEVCLEIPPVEENIGDKNIVIEMDIQVQSTVDKPDDSPNIALQVTPLPMEKHTEETIESAMELVNENISDIINEVSETNELDDSPNIAVEATPLPMEKHAEETIESAMELVNENISDIINEVSETNKPDDSPNIALEVTPLPLEKHAEETIESAMELVNENISDIINEVSETNEPDDSPNIALEVTPLPLEKHAEETIESAMELVNENISDIINEVSETNNPDDSPNIAVEATPLPMEKHAEETIESAMELVNENISDIINEVSETNKPDDSPNIAVEVTPLPMEKHAEETIESAIELINENISDVMKEVSETNNVPEGSSVKESIDGIGDITMDVDDNCELDQSSQSENVDAEKVTQVHKYVTVKKIADMVYPATPITEDITTDVPDIDLAQIDKNLQTEVMDVDTTLDNSISLDTISDKNPPIQQTEIESQLESDVEMANTIPDEDKTSEGCEENPALVTPMAVKQQNNSDLDTEINGTAVMKENDCLEEPVIEESECSNNTENNSKNTLNDVSVCDESKQNAVIDIIDNDDDDCVKDNDATHVIPVDDIKSPVSEESQKNITDVEKVKKMKEKVIEKNSTHNVENEPEDPQIKQLPVVCKLSNTMDILSDDEEFASAKPIEEKKTLNENLSPVEEQNKCINLDDDDDIMFIEDTNSQAAISKEENKSEEESERAMSQTIKTTHDKISDNTENEAKPTNIEDVKSPKICEQDSTKPVEVETKENDNVKPDVKNEDKPVEPSEPPQAKPLLTTNFLKSVTKNLADMTRNELEDFCVVKLVESIVDKGNLNEIKNKLKTLSQTVEDLRKKSLALAKQNRDLQVVVKSVQEDQKKRNPNPMMPMKITRSVGLQVLLSAGERNVLLKRKISTPSNPPPMVPTTRPVRNMQSPKNQKPVANSIPVPRLVPASSPTVKSPVTPVSNTKPTVTPTRNTTPQRPEKRPLTKPSPSSDTVDLTDDEPPAKINTKNPTPPVRLVPSQSLMAPKNRPQFSQTGNSPRKVYIPISSSNPNVRPPPVPSVIKNFVPAPRPRPPSVVRMQTLRVNQLPSASRHPAPLPDAMKQYQPPTWKALPPAPDLKLSKVDNGIVISWKFEGCQPDSYEEVASFQLYAYQETPAPPSTTLWKKIGDIKALPLPMACTLTQFMSGFKYYFAVRAIDVRSRIGPFSLPGSIMLISKS